MLLRTLARPFTRSRSRLLPPLWARLGRGQSTEAAGGAVTDVAVGDALSAAAPGERVVIRLLRQLPPPLSVAAGVAAVALLTVVTLVVTSAGVANSPSRLDQETALASVSTPLVTAAANAPADAAATSSTPAAESASSEGTTIGAPASASSDAPAAEAEAPLLVAFWTVQAGDSLSALASEFGTKVKTIIAYNGLEDASNLRVGQELAIPVQPGLSVADDVDVVELSAGERWVVSWTVSDGDSLLALAYRFRTTVDAIVARNDLSDSSAIRIGQSLEIPIGFQPPLGSTAHPLSTNGQDLYNCASFGSWEEAQAVFEANLPGDPNLIDSNNNGVACEALRAR